MDKANLHQKFLEYGRNAKEWKRKCALLLPEIEKHKIWREKGFHSIYEYAAKLAGMSHSQVDDALRVLKKIQNKPSLMNIAKIRGVNAVRPVATIATEESEKFWAEKAKTMSKNDLETFVREIRRQDAKNSEVLSKRDLPKQSLFQEHEPDDAPEQAKFKTVMLRLKPGIAEKLEELSGESDEALNEMMLEFMEFKKKKEEAKKEQLESEKPNPVKTSSRHIPAAIKKYILKRAGEKCELPECGKPYKHLHHINRFASSRVHDPDKIVALCKSHHNIAHLGLIENEDQPVKEWRIRKNPDYTNLNWFIDHQVQFYRRI